MFIYVTLKTGQPNHQVLDGAHRLATFPGWASMLEPYPLVIARGTASCGCCSFQGTGSEWLWRSNCGAADATLPGRVPRLLRYVPVHLMKVAI